MSLRVAQSGDWFLDCFCQCGARAHQAVTEFFDNKHFDTQGELRQVYAKLCLLVQVVNHAVGANPTCQRYRAKTTVEFVEFLSGTRCTVKLILQHDPTVSNYTNDQLATVVNNLNNAIYADLVKLEKDHIPYEIGIVVEQVGDQGSHNNEVGMVCPYGGLFDAFEGITMAVGNSFLIEVNLVNTPFTAPTVSAVIYQNSLRG